MKFNLQFESLLTARVFFKDWAEILKLFNNLPAIYILRFAAPSLFACLFPLCSFFFLNVMRVFFSICLFAFVSLSLQSEFQGKNWYFRSSAKIISFNLKPPFPWTTVLLSCSLRTALTLGHTAVLRASQRRTGATVPWAESPSLSLHFDFVLNGQPGIEFWMRNSFQWDSILSPVLCHHFSDMIWNQRETLWGLI